MNSLSFYPTNAFVHPFDNAGVNQKISRHHINYQQAQQYPPMVHQQHKLQDFNNPLYHTNNVKYTTDKSYENVVQYQNTSQPPHHLQQQQYNGYNPFYTSNNNYATTAITANTAVNYPQQTNLNLNHSNYSTTSYNTTSTTNTTTTTISKPNISHRSNAQSSTNKLEKPPRPASYEHPNSQSLESWNFSGESTSKIYQTLNRRADFHKGSAHSRIVFVKKVFGWLAVHDREYLNNHKTVDLVVAISDIINMIISLIELHRAPSFVLYLIILASDRFVERTGINHHQIFNLLLTSAIVNLKFWNESIYIQNKTIADIFSFNVKDLNTMERRFLYGLDYNLCVTEEQLQKYIEQIKNQSISNMVLSNLEKK